MNPFATNLRNLRLEKGMTQEQSAEKLGVSAQSVSRWETGQLLPDTATLPDLAQILGTTVDAILTGGDCPPAFRRRVTVDRIREAMGCIQRLREILGSEHFFYRTMVDALDKRIHSQIEMAYHSARAMDAYVCEALLACIDQGDYVDRSDVQKSIDNERASSVVLACLDELSYK